MYGNEQFYGGSDGSFFGTILSGLWAKIVGVLKVVGKIRLLE